MNPYIIIIAPTAKKQIDALQLSMRGRIASALEILAQNPFIGKSLRAELKGLYSYRVGDYRIIYSVIAHKLIIEVIKVMHRREAYRRK